MELAVRRKLWDLQKGGEIFDSCHALFSLNPVEVDHMFLLCSRPRTYSRGQWTSYNGEPELAYYDSISTQDMHLDLFNEHFNDPSRLRLEYYFVTECNSTGRMQGYFFTNTVRGINKLGHHYNGARFVFIMDMHHSDGSVGCHLDMVLEFIFGQMKKTYTLRTYDPHRPLDLTPCHTFADDEEEELESEPEPEQSVPLAPGISVLG